MNNEYQDEHCIALKKHRIHARNMFLLTKYNLIGVIDDISEYLAPKDPAKIIHGAGGLLSMKTEKLMQVYEALPWEAQKLRHRYLANKRRHEYLGYAYKIRMENFDYYLSIGHYHE